MKMDIQPSAVQTLGAPDSLISNSGQVQYGHFDGPVKSFGLEHFRYTNVMDKPASHLARHFHFKQFQFVSVVTPRYVIGVAIADIRYAGTGFCYLYDIKANQLVETTWLKPLAMGCQLADSPWAGRAQLASGKGRVTIEIVEGIWQLNIDTAQIKAELMLTPMPLSLPMAMCNPTGYSGWTYTQKHNCLKLGGSLTIHHEPQPLNRALAGYDFSAGYMRRETSWRWASINGYQGDDLLGLNLAAGVNETGCNENVFWVNGERHLLGPVHFAFSRAPESADDASWQISSQDGRVALNFRPLNRRQEKLNLWLLKSNFRQYLGYFDGEIRDGLGRTHRIDNLLGLTEDHFARW
ncbi:DUF2804 domain-containing protein [Shewanella halotolerans]|uniref:DUF2804 domain-containing protein n=1 Tax=Shewanella halotolerans TaxID=2864204 RepID=UPI001C654C4E|nr:DUF2804 domain-containing protein [Shewanella halotolerans]QYJ90987.1 DUF2804 domain-containing protein [Shewanella halotolerans]